MQFCFRTFLTSMYTYFNLFYAFNIEFHSRADIFRPCIFAFLFDLLADFQTCLQNCEKRLLAWSCLSVRPSVSMAQLGTHWTDFHLTLYLSTFRKFVKKIQICLETDKTNVNFTWRPIHIFYHISLSPSQNEKCFRKILQRKQKHNSCSVKFFYSS